MSIPRERGNAEGFPGVYEAMRTSTASSHSPPGAHRPPASRSRSYPPAASPPGARGRSPSSGAYGGSAPERAGPGRTVDAGADGAATGRADVDGAAIAVDGDPATDVDHVLAEDGFSAFYRDAWPGVARALALALGDRDLAVEATDEAMARAYPRWRKLSAYDNPGAWVYRVGLNWARSYRRRLARRPPPDGHRDVHLPPVGDPAVRAALLTLPVAQRSVVVCRLLLDWSVEDTAVALGIRPATVRTRQHRALRSLHTALDHLR